MKRRAFLEETSNEPPYKKAAIIPSPKPTLSLAQSQAVRREVNKQLARKAEYKQTLNSRTNATTIDYSGTVYSLLENLVRGDSSLNNFDGSSISVKSIRIRGEMFPADGSNVLRMIVFQWRDSGTPSVSGIINNSGTPLGPFGTRYFANKKTMKILADRICIAHTYKPACLVDIFVPGNKIRPTWFQTSNDSPASNGLFFLVISDSSTVAHPAFQWTSEVVFTD